MKWLRETDRVKWTREVRDRINEEIVAMSDRELRECFSQRPTDAVLGSLYDPTQQGAAG